MNLEIFEKTWDSEIVKHKGFEDLGNYVIKLPDYDDPSVIERGLGIGNLLGDHVIPEGGCTAMAKRNSDGEVVIGRNMDLDISQNPAYVFMTTFGKYKNFCVTYFPGVYLSYEEVQKLDEIDPVMMDMIPFTVCDSMNEKGLYMEANLREMNEKLVCYGLHSAHGEKTRDDGTPWSELRACTTEAIQLVTQNCATVKEAIEFLNNSYDWYTITPLPQEGLVLKQNNMCFMIGDATGEYGLIEFAQDKINYIPYQYGQANFYITPQWSALDTWGSGHGRLEMVSQVIGDVETLDDAMDAMKPIMWRNETLWLDNSERITDGTHLNPYDQVVFKDDNGIPQIDWRGDYATLFPVMEDGRMIIEAKLYEIAEKSTYDPKIKEYLDEAIATGRMVIDDGSIKFDVNGEQLTLSELSAKYDEYLLKYDNPDKEKELRQYFNAYWDLLTREDSSWVYDDYNFEALKAAAYARMNIRYDADGEFDPSSMSKYEKLIAFYGHGVEKDETPLRDDADIWTTSINTGVNCAKKEMKVRFWENDDVICHIKF